jgi:hypothetical protein
MTAYNGVSVYPDLDKSEILIRLFDSTDPTVLSVLRLGWDDARHLASLINAILTEVAA